MSAVPGPFYRDGTFVPADADRVGCSRLRVRRAPARRDARGQRRNPDAYRRMTLQIPAGAGAASVFHFADRALRPAAQGAINVVDYAENCQDFDGDLVHTESSMALEQGAAPLRLQHRRHLQQVGLDFGARPGEPARRGLRQFDGPACPRRVVPRLLVQRRAVALRLLAYHVRPRRCRYARHRQLKVTVWR